jgi:peptidoglycan/LPS O-acetylase OafA/YrhL
MKKCPECNRTYSDDTLSFCLEDGTLLSASYNPQETNTPTVAINAGEIPTVVAPREAPTAFNTPPRPTEQLNDSAVGWKAYLAALLISLVVDLVYTYLLFPIYENAVQDYYYVIQDKFDDAALGLIVANYIIRVPLNTIVSALSGFVLGFIFPRAKWKMGIIAEVPNLAFTLYYVLISLADGHNTPFYYIRAFFITILYIIVACLFAALGARLSPRRDSR